MNPVPVPQKLGRYELLTLLACGGMAEVYLARATGIGGFTKQLVIKRILPHLTGDPDFVEMFLNEGRIAARLSHPNVCQVFELGEVDGGLFLAMEYLDGLSWGELSPYVPHDGGFDLRCAATVLGQACEGLRYAHELCDVHGAPTPVVHRDVSPQNLMVTTDGVAKLVDFGVSKVLNEGSRTRTGMLKGKLPYMAPEQIRGEPVDARADVFSMGVVLWEALVGERLFRRDTDYQIWRAITEEDIPTATSRRPSLPAAVDAVIARALARDAAERTPSIRVFAAELRQLAELVGGPLEPSQLAEVVRSYGRAELAERARKLSVALGRGSQAQPALDLIAVAPRRADGSSVQLRDDSVRVGRRGTRWGWVVLGGALMAAGGAGAALWLAGGTPPPLAADRAHTADDTATAVLRDAHAAPDLAAAASAPVDAAPPAIVDAAPAGLAVEPAVEPPVAAPPAASDGAALDGGGRRPGRRRPPAHRPSEPAEPVEPGQYSVDSRPYATIFIDGKSYGETPLFKLALPPGKHRVRAVTSTGEIQHYTIAIEPGKLTSSGTLTW